MVVKKGRGLGGKQHRGNGYRCVRQAEGGEKGGAVKSGRGLSAVERGAWVCAGKGDGNKQLKAL